MNLDESVSMWYGSLDKEDPTSIPNVTFIPGKPRDKGIYIKCSSCAETKIMLQLELQGCKDEEKKFAYRTNTSSKTDAEYNYLRSTHQLYQKHTALSLRLVEPFFNTNRVIIMDANFASVSTTNALKCHGLDSIGMVKTNKHCRLLYGENDKVVRRRK